MSVVYQATDEVLRRPVAVKVFHSGSVDIARQDAELGVLASLEHHNLVGLLDAGVLTNADGAQQRFLVMSLVVGQDLEARLKVGPLAVRHIAEVGFDMAEALHYIHAHGVVHRDIKPSNILLVDYGHDADRARARLTDFGSRSRRAPNDSPPTASRPAPPPTSAPSRPAAARSDPRVTSTRSASSCSSASPAAGSSPAPSSSRRSHGSPATPSCPSRSPSTGSPRCAR